MWRTVNVHIEFEFNFDNVVLLLLKLYLNFHTEACNTFLETTIWGIIMRFSNQVAFKQTFYEMQQIYCALCGYAIIRKY